VEWFAVHADGHLLRCFVDFDEEGRACGRGGNERHDNERCEARGSEQAKVAETHGQTPEPGPDGTKHSMHRGGKKADHGLFNALGLMALRRRALPPPVFDFIPERAQGSARPKRQRKAAGPSSQLTQLNATGTHPGIRCPRAGASAGRKESP
jgi:hypothetical protein